MTILVPTMASWPKSNYAVLDFWPPRHPDWKLYYFEGFAIAFDDKTDEAIEWYPLRDEEPYVQWAIIEARMDYGRHGSVAFRVALQTPDAVPFEDSAMLTVAVPLSGEPFKFRIPLGRSNATLLPTPCIFRIQRLASSEYDTAVGDCLILHVVLSAESEGE